MCSGMPERYGVARARVGIARSDPDSLNPLPGVRTTERLLSAERTCRLQGKSFFASCCPSTRTNTATRCRASSRPDTRLNGTLKILLSRPTFSDFADSYCL